MEDHMLISPFQYLLEIYIYIIFFLPDKTTISNGLLDVN